VTKRGTARSTTTPTEHVVVVGAGFGGLTLVRELARKRRRGAPVEVTVIDRNNHHTFQPLLYQVATAGLQPQDIGVSLRAILRRHEGVHVRLGEVVGIDHDALEVEMADGGRVPYDRLVLAAGGQSEDLGIPGVAEHAFGLKWIPDAIALRNHVLRRFELASARPEHRHDGTLTFVIAGGGPTGVELAGTLAELVDLVLRRDHPELDVGNVRIVLAEPMEQLLTGFSETSGREALLALQQRGIDVRLGVGVARADAGQVQLTDDEVIPTATLVWAAGISAAPLADVVGVELGRGRRIPVDGQLRVEGLARVHAIGDIAASLDRDGQPLPQLAPVAIQQARYVADLVVAEAEGSTRKPFRYRDKGSMATIGRLDAVAELPGRIRLRGVVAWIAWLVLHLFMLVGFKNRVGVLGNWVWNYVTYDHSARLILEQDAQAGDLAEPEDTLKSS
jgi:NADH:ubiquinone reductase (H+-translocating)